ncbi:siderophore-interacting protein [Acidovorax sp.]|uniref:siderophore-interacting protein n=1 Tax=Acidovorax sp. TaxID=1872122 RepID=UPI002ACEBBA3|nr:siderophore-interacting protein [Acidovorax sp.]MDZ7864789.1 siderophore-interacting protein [Acidovorax sp.]
MTFEPLSAAVPADALAISRVRHTLKARHAQVLRRTQVSPGFVRLTLGGPDLADFVSAGFDDHLKLILPLPGQERAALPTVQDGRSVMPEPRPVLRDYTPAHYDAARGELDIEVALHDAGPASDWAAAAAVGHWVGVAGPRGSMVVPTAFAWHWLLGDETAVPAIVRRLAELPAEAAATVRIQVRNPADRRPLASAAKLDLQWVDSLPEAAQALTIPEGDGYIWAAGEHADMAALRKVVLAKPGVNPKRMRIAAYWKKGVADHHEDLPA